MNHRISRRRQTVAVKRALRELANQLSLFTHRMAGRVGLKSLDVDCLDLISRTGPISPGGLARRAGLHPATVTGILDRLERGGWVARQRDGKDRRGVVVTALPTRNRELVDVLGGLNAAMDQLCADYTADELELIAGFLRRMSEAGREATAALSE